MPCKFEIEILSDPESFIHELKVQFQSIGSLTGNTRDGHFIIYDPIIFGSYMVEDNELKVRITDKPFLYPCNKIKAKFDLIDSDNSFKGKSKVH